MMESATGAAQSQSQGRRAVGMTGGGRSETEKEKTKMRERHRRAITTKIFHGLRKYGGYRLSPRADINEVLRHLAMEAGWVVETDGTTYRRSNVMKCCPVCGAASVTPTPTSSVVIGGACGGDCSTTASPRSFTAGSPSVTATIGGGRPSICLSGGTSSSHQNPIPTTNNNTDISMALYMYGAALRNPSAVSSSSSVEHKPQLQEARASNQNTPVSSPMPRV